MMISFVSFENDGLSFRIKFFKIMEPYTTYLRLMFRNAEKMH